MAFYWAAMNTAHRRPLEASRIKVKVQPVVCAGSPWLGGTPHVGLLIAGIHSCYCEHKEAGFFSYVLYQVLPAGHSLAVTPIRPCVLHVLLEGCQSDFSSEVGNGSHVLPYRVPNGVPNVFSMCSLILSHMLIIPMCLYVFSK